MTTLVGRVAVVAGASRGAGRGIALALGEAGATVYVAGRTSRDGAGSPAGIGGTIEETAEAVTARGGQGVAVRADLTVESEVASLFARIRSESKRLDVAASAVWGGGDPFRTVEEWMASMGVPFWEQSERQWQQMMRAGPYAYWRVAAHAVPLMKETGGGVIAGVTDGVVTSDAEAEWADFPGQLIWNVAHTCINRLLRGMAGECKPHGIAVITLMPGFMRTERVEAFLTTESLRKRFGHARSESTEYVGRAVAALAADRAIMKKTGRLHFVADLAAEYGFTDVDGRLVPRFDPFG